MGGVCEENRKHNCEVEALLPVKYDSCYNKTVANTWQEVMVKDKTITFLMDAWESRQ